MDEGERVVVFRREGGGLGVGSKKKKMVLPEMVDAERGREKEPKQEQGGRGSPTRGREGKMGKILRVGGVGQRGAFGKAGSGGPESTVST